MSVLNVKYLGSSVLNRQAKKITAINREIIHLAEDMLETMYRYCGVGLAAPQVGISKQMIVVDCGERYQKEPLVLINPMIVKHKGLQAGEEGCLSLPGFTATVTRPSRVVVKGLDRDGREQMREGTGLLARAFQHEMDHLDGRLFVDRLRGIKRDLIVRKIKKRARAGEW